MKLTMHVVVIETDFLQIKLNVSWKLSVRYNWSLVIIFVYIYDLS